MTNLKELHGKVCDDIRSRQQWLSRQSVWYAMRHDGLRRRQKPWPHAADLHYPLADSIIERLKPFYFSQLFGTETLAQFIAKEPELVPYAQDAGAWFDFKLKQQSNLEAELLVGIDKMLMAGHVPVKVYWEPGTKGQRGRLAFDAIEPQHCIVPESTQALEQADRVTLVHHLSREQYKRDARFRRQEEEFLKRITGRGTSESGAAPELEESRQLREGLTHSAGEEGTIIVWEIWEQDGEGWMVHWISPLAPEEALRPSQRNPFQHGRLPIVRFDGEIKDKGHYAARGIPEKAGAFEASLCKYWNEKSDYLTLCNRPLFTSSTPIPNAANLRFVPGQIVPGGVSAIQMPPPPVSFDQEMVQTRMIAEYHIGMPDFGLAQGANGGHRRTATEVDKVSGLMGMNVDLRARTFRMSLGTLLQLAWATLLQYDREARFYVGSELRELRDKAMAAEGWLIQPNGSSETWNRQAQFQRALLRKQLFAQSPWINQPELDRSILELDDPRLVKRLLVDPQERQLSEYEDEATKIPTLVLGLPLAVRPEEDQAARIKCLLDFLHQRGALRAPVDHVAVTAIRARMAAHLRALGKKDPAQAKELRGKIAQLLTAHAQPGTRAPERRPRRGPAPADVPTPLSAAPISTENAQPQQPRPQEEEAMV